MNRKPLSSNLEVPEMRPDGGQQFERAIDAAVKSGPKHRPGKAQPAKRTAGKGRARVGKARI